jgi:flagellin
MSLSIQTNVNSLMAQENLRVNNDFQARTIGRLTSGYRINSSGDDAAGLSVANKFRSDVAELQQGVRNANDGISTLQIIDGGLNNISKMLDRLKTLATQSASGTFTGDRNILNNEYSALLTEIDRQASNIGLSVGANGGRYNTNIDVYVGGGGSSQGNSKLSINLAGAANRADSAGLQINGTSIAGGGATTFGDVNLNVTTPFLVGASASQSFTFNITRPGEASFTTTVQVDGDADGITSDEAIGQLNSALSSLGISASKNSSTGFLQFSGDVAFTARSTASTADSLSANATAKTAANGSMYRVNSTADGAYANVATSASTATFTVGSKSVNVSLAVGTTQAQALAQYNAALQPLGIFAVNDADGNNIEFQSASAFTVDQTGGTATTMGVFASITDENAISVATTGTATSAAEAAITSLTSAVSRLGALQGTVGTAQNKLQYAVQLAQSQISNFSAAESRIRDADVAAEAANLTKAQVLQQASLAAMAQANSAPQAVLSLLRG